LAIVFIITCKTHKYELLFYNILVLCINLACCMIDVLEIENALNELNMIFIYYEMDPKIGIYFKVILNIKIYTLKFMC